MLAETLGDVVAVTEGEAEGDKEIDTVGVVGGVRDGGGVTDGDAVVVADREIEGVGEGSADGLNVGEGQRWPTALTISSTVIF